MIFLVYKKKKKSLPKNLHTRIDTLTLRGVTLIINKCKTDEVIPPSHTHTHTQSRLPLFHAHTESRMLTPDNDLIPHISPPPLHPLTHTHTHSLVQKGSVH